WGYMEMARAQWREEQQRQAVFPRPPTRRQRAQRQRPAAAVSKAAAYPPVPRAPAPARPDLAQQLTALQAALPGSRGEVYLLQAGAEPLWVCEGPFDALALLAAGVRRVVAIFGVHGWRWDWVREVRALVFALDADPTGQQQWRQLARQAALRGKQVAVLEPAASGGQKDVRAAWPAGLLRVEARPVAARQDPAPLEVPEDRREAGAERVALRVTDGRGRGGDGGRA